ncbi:MAG: succinylglutamate-semialdehyde dehydrogenase [Gammaproteobacteria bacterium]|nr:succinylglutamate-semialdehyde dehydrogenase [Gammaproteobacteria bacterium]
MPIHPSKGHFINGHWLKGQGEPFEAVNPCDAQPIWEGFSATQSEVHQAFDAARRALPSWRQFSLQARSLLIQQFLDSLKQDKPALISSLSLETGKPLWEAEQEINAVLDKLNHALLAYQLRTQDETIVVADKQLQLRFKPIGVVGILGAFNFPIHLSHGHLIPALLAGNTVIYKPSELTPCINEILMGYWEKSGLPPGVLNMIQGDARTAQHLIQCPIEALYFTGSYQTGQRIHASLHNRPEVLLALEMGGNNPLIVDTVKNLDAALYHALVSSFITAGQRCSCTRRLLIPNTAFGEQFIDRFVQAARQLHIDIPNANPAPFMGPVIRRAHALQHLEKQQALIQQGAQPLLSMTLLSEQGAFLSPGILDMENAHTIKDEEVFAPLVQVYRYDTFEEALHLANQTQYGLTAGCLTDNPAHYDYFYQHSRAGILTWNCPTTGASSRLPFGGTGKSGNHRPSAFFAADYCAYPVACTEQTTLELPTTRLPGMSL